MTDTMFATVVGGVHSKNYLVYAKALIRSVVDKHPGFAFPWTIVHDRLTKKQQDEMKDEFPFVAFKKIAKTKYAKLGNPKYYSFEFANLKARRVIGLDADMICDGNLGILKPMTAPLLMPREPRRSCLCACLIIINQPGKQLYDSLFATKHDKGFGVDQNIWNQMGVTPIENKDARIVRFARKDHPGTEHPLFWHFIDKSSEKDVVERTTPAALALWKKYAKEGLPFAKVRKKK